MNQAKKPKPKQLAAKLRGKKDTSSQQDSVQATPKVTNKTVEEHRNEVIRKARKFIYPTHTKRQIVYVSISLLIASIVVFLAVCGFLLYKTQNTSTFIYRVTQVVPFPVAKAGNDYVSYENYLFEVRHYEHYYRHRSQQPIDFDTKSGQDQLNHYKHQALDKVINLAYAKQLADKHNISVSAQDIDKELSAVENRGLLGRSRQQLGQVLQQTFGWSVSDFRRELKSEILLNKISSKLDKQAHKTADTVLSKLQNGAKFADLAEKYSDDKDTKTRGGRYQDTISRSSTNLPSQVITAAFNLKKGQHSTVVETSESLEIIKLIDSKQGKLKLAHIQIDLKPASHYIKPLKSKNPPNYYIHLKK